MNSCLVSGGYTLNGRVIKDGWERCYKQWDIKHAKCVERVKKKYPTFDLIDPNGRCKENGINRAKRKSHELSEVSNGIVHCQWYCVILNLFSGMSGQLMLPMGDHYPLAGNPRLLETESATLGTIMWVVTMTEATAVCLQLETEIALTHAGAETSFMVARIVSKLSKALNLTNNYTCLPPPHDYPQKTGMIN